MKNNLYQHSQPGVLLLCYETNRDGQRYKLPYLDTSHGFLFSLKRAKEVDKWNNHLNFYLAQ